MSREWETIRSECEFNEGRLHAHNKHVCLHDEEKGLAYHV